MAASSSHPRLEYNQARHPSWPYHSSDFTRMDPTSDASFYDRPRFVNHIDDNAISLLGDYYAQNLPPRGRIVELCSSWVSHLPEELQRRAESTVNGHEVDGLHITGYGMNAQELAANPALEERVVRDLNVEPSMYVEGRKAFDAATCVVSIDYLIQPLEVLESLRASLTAGATVHLVISNRCFPTKVVGRWLKVDEQERLQMVADYLWWSGFRNIEILTLSDGKGFGGLPLHDPLWVVRGKNVPNTLNDGEKVEL